MSRKELEGMIYALRNHYSESICREKNDILDSLSAVRRAGIANSIAIGRIVEYLGIELKTEPEREYYVKKKGKK